MIDATKDTSRHQGLRKKLIDELQQKGITDEQVLQAMRAVPRHLFFDSVFTERAYEDKAFPIAAGQTISQPFTVAYQSQLLRVKPREKVLEIGTGSGYQAAILHQMGAKVYSIERQRTLFSTASALLRELGYTSIQTFYGDGFEGLPTYAPFDKIIITAGASVIPEKLLHQLKTGGFMVIPFGDKSQKMLRITRNGNHQFSQEEFGDFTFVPLLPGKVN
ncbi:MAG: protein-L-isoaspartate(D-aspartate) O-methyltransferase [Bacteroidetes bacterium]|nr:protein-L-isoaspartate(D-aspartate) O-methyltransferase [Bacteroidota bacterium]